MWLTFPCGQNSDWREALYVDFPSRLDFIICSSRRLCGLWNEPEEAEVLAEGAAGHRSSWRWTGPFCLGGSLIHSSLVHLRTKRALALRGCFRLPLSTRGNLHVRTETCMKYHRVIILDNIQHYAGGTNKSFHCSHENTHITAAFQSELWRVKCGRENIFLCLFPAL